MENSMLSPMPGKILKLFVGPGDRVAEGDSLLILEAMKMEHTVKANRAGRIAQIYFKEGQLVDGGVDLVDIEGDGDGDGDGGRPLV